MTDSTHPQRLGLVVQPTLYPNCVCTKAALGFQEYEYILFTTFGYTYICRQWIMDQELETVHTNNTSHLYIQSTAQKMGVIPSLEHIQILG